MTLLMKIFHTFKGDCTTAIDCQVFAAVELCHLIVLIASANQHHVAARGDLAADVGDMRHLISLGFLPTERAFAFLVVERVITILSGEDVELVARHQVGFVACGDAA